MVAIPFPAGIKPTGRSYNPGRYPMAEFRSINGATTRMLYSNRRSDAELDLQFQNITDGDAAAILVNYERVAPTGDWVSFSSGNGALGAEATLATYLKENGGSGLRWRYNGPPDVRSVVPGRSTVQVKFVGHLDAN